MVVRTLLPPMARIWFIGDTHIGETGSFYKNVFDFVLNSNEKDYFVFLGDIIDNAIKDSIADVYKQDLPPQQQIEEFLSLLSEIKHRVLLLLQGNHERRTERTVGIDVYAVLSKAYNIAYARNWAILDVNSKLAIAVTHGIASGRYPERAVRQNRFFEEFVQGCDIYVSAHVHIPSIVYQKRYYFDETKRALLTKDIVFATVGGFVDAEYSHQRLLPPSSFTLLCVELKENGYDAYHRLILKGREICNL